MLVTGKVLKPVRLPAVFKILETNIFWFCLCISNAWVKPEALFTAIQCRIIFSEMHVSWLTYYCLHSLQEKLNHMLHVCECRTVHIWLIPKETSVQTPSRHCPTALTLLPREGAAVGTRVARIWKRWRKYCFFLVFLTLLKLIQKWP